jgi:hypothetical protein
VLEFSDGKGILTNQGVPVIRQHIFVSHASRPPTYEDLIHIMERSVAHNAAKLITGLLLYDHGRFISCLEGKTEHVTEVLARIHADKHHEGMLVLYDRTAHVDRIFPNWSMGFHHMKILEKAVHKGLQPNDLADIKRRLERQSQAFPAQLLHSIIDCNDLTYQAS